MVSVNTGKHASTAIILASTSTFNLGKLRKTERLKVKIPDSTQTLEHSTAEICARLFKQGLSFTRDHLLPYLSFIEFA